MVMLFESNHSAGEGSPGGFRVEGEDHEYEDFVGDTFPTAPPDLPSPISDDEITILTQKKSIKAEQACASEKKSRESPKRFRTHTSSRIPDNTEIIDLESIQPSIQRQCWDLTKEIAKAEDDNESLFTIKKEDAGESFPWRDMGSEIIELLDSDDETAVLPYSDLSIVDIKSTKALDDAAAVQLNSELSTMNSESIKARDDEIAILPLSDRPTMDSKSTKAQSNISQVLSSAKRARQSPIVHAKMLEIQRKYIARVLEKSIPSAAGAGAGLKDCQPPSEQSATDGQEDQHAWMKANVDFDIDAAATFVSPGLIYTYTDSSEDLPT